MRSGKKDLKPKNIDSIKAKLNPKKTKLGEWRSSKISELSLLDL